MLASFSCPYKFVNLPQGHRGHGEFGKKLEETTLHAYDSQEGDEVVHSHIRILTLLEMADGRVADAGLFSKLPLTQPRGEAIVLHPGGKSLEDSHICDVVPVNHSLIYYYLAANIAINIHILHHNSRFTFSHYFGVLGGLTLWKFNPRNYAEQ